jgi:hypothetical protein
MRYATPQWVERAGAKGYDFTPGKGAHEGGDARRRYRLGAIELTPPQ